MRYQGGCHCGAVRYEVEVDLSSPITCNCSYCSKRGSVLAFTPADNFTIEKGADNLTEYRFNAKKIEHLFCSTCGMQSFGRGAMPDGTRMVAVNVRCLDGVDVGAINIHEVDGRSL
ncbi:GFA family protein [Nitratireductor sp. CAU 1489]|uniref:GFA family protein n=1 Tax=Nitratireductor arenosus TaxID=2682096 RepID=A0A844QB23_9HYPH|nr:GFA family protein [Nitratireductor arenosus]MVA96147.1 GFA family protein [Nitratireductor arenosus]